jgi:DNA-binding response OmpR family regulator
VDDVSDTAEVLQAVLEPRGVTVNRIGRWGLYELTANENRPDVLILDAESLAGHGAPSGADWQGVPQIIIGTIQPLKDVGAGSDLAESGATEPDRDGVHRRYFDKPFQFAELLHAIESLMRSPAVVVVGSHQR